MNKITADQLAIDLLKLMRSGNDARTIIDFICNHLRIKKKEATSLYTFFESGVHAGCGAVINGDENSLQEGQNHPLYCAAYKLGCDDFKNKLREKHLKQKPKKLFADHGLIFSIVLILVIIIVILLI